MARIHVTQLLIIQKNSSFYLHVNLTSRRLMVELNLEKRPINLHTIFIEFVATLEAIKTFNPMADRNATAERMTYVHQTQTTSANY